MAVAVELEDARTRCEVVDSTACGELAHVSVVARRAAQVASLLGVTFSFDHVAAMLDIAPMSLLAPVEELVDLNVLVDVGTAMSFVDDRVRRAVLETLPQPARPALQRQAIEVLVKAGASPVEPAIGLAESAHAGDRPAISALLAAAQAVSVKDPPLAVELCRRAFDLTTPGDELRGAVAAELTLLLHAVDRADEANVVADVALREDVTPEAHTRIRMNVVEMPGLAPEVRVETGRVALSVPGVAAEWRARHLPRMADNLLEMGCRRAAQQLLPDAAKEVDAAGDPMATLALKLANSRLAYMDGEFQNALEQLESGGSGRLATRDHRTIAVDQWHTELLLVLDQFESAERATEEGLAIAQHSRHSWAERSWRQLYGRVLMQAGRLADAATALGGVLPGTGNASPPSTVADAAALAALGLIATHTGDGRAARAVANAAEIVLEERRTTEVHRQLVWTLALQDHARGDLARAHARLAPLEDDDVRSPMPLLMIDVTDPIALVRIGLAANDEALAASAATVADERCSRSQTAESLAAVAAQARGLLTSDVDALADAVRLFGSSFRRLAQGSAQEDLGIELSRRGDRAGGTAELERALRTYSDAGATWDAARVRSRLRSFGVRSRLVKRVRPAGGWGALTESEIAVAKLVADGLKNREVAERLFVSRHTVSMHLRNAFAKLNINSRVELTRLVFEMEQAG
jgi:DNA-binding NarL/FixJ family response regulator